MKTLKDKSMYRPQHYNFSFRNSGSGPSVYVFQSPLINFGTEPSLGITELNQSWLLGAGERLTLSYNSVPLEEFEWTWIELPHDNQYVYF